MRDYLNKNYKLKYRPEIDSLRAIAVIAVIIYHAKINLFGYQLFPGGYLGCLLYTSPSPRDGLLSRMPSSA